jgi:ABC-type bacteriocin/lantibiotic exporter with double-glycine peptidase domain
MVLLANGVYIVAFLILAFQLSSRFSVLADAYSRSAVELGSLQSNMVLNLNFIQRLGLKDFLHVALESRTLPSWGAFDNVRRFHAKRWFVQLNLFNLMYFGTMLYGVLQVKEGFLALGFLLLIKWSFDELWKVLVYAIEYYVALIQQRADAQLLRGALAPHGHQTLSAGATFSLGNWSKIELRSARADFVSNGGERCVAIQVPRLTIARGEWVGIVGPSGSGKSTTLLMLMNILRHGGTLSVDDESIGERRLSPKDVSIVTTTDPLFKISLRDNLILGREIHDDAVLEALAAAGVDFALSLNSVVGSADFNLSAGQEQRIRLARGLLHPGSLLLLDEPFTALDQATKTTVRQRIKEHLTGRSVVIVTHAAEDLLLVGREYEMADGVLCERGASCSD